MRPWSEHLALNEKQAVETFVQRLLSEFGQGVSDARLFGSKARGEAGPDSDVDILVLVKRSDYAFKHAILWLAAEVSLTHDVLLSPRVVPSLSWERMVQADTLFYRTVSAEGLPLLPSTQASHPVTSSA